LIQSGNPLIDDQPMHLQPWNMILLGFLLSVLGVALPFLMVVHAVPSTFFLNFLSFTASMGGLILGIAGASLYIRQHRK
jgi:hypothetical protein